MTTRFAVDTSVTVAYLDAGRRAVDEIVAGSPSAAKLTVVASLIDELTRP